MNWNDIKLKDYYKIIEIQKEGGDDMMIKMVSYLFDCDAPALPINEFLSKCNQLQFLSTEIPSSPVAKSYTVNGSTYTFDYTTYDMTTAQFFDFQNYSKQKDNMVDILSVFLIPDSHTYNDGYDMAKVKDDIQNLSIVDVNAIYTFFLHSFENCIKLLTRFLKLGKMKMKKEERKLVDQLISQIGEYCHL